MSARGTWRDLIVVASRWAVGVVFLVASIDKLAHPGAFAQNIANYRLIPLVLLHPFAWLLPVVEAVVGLALIVGWQRRGAALLATIMTAVFIAAIASALARDLDISCGCFHTTGGHAVGRDLLVRDLLLLGAALVAVLGPPDRLALDGRRGRGR
ncbi:MAG TPA: MauE/DoxX family redox-associated membrane protein [Candidatus Krumholzibacteria bacterium]|nr:MauE/DoxX family redox-associated membrane protein [Candidatus Krumholzibacteria bacterium]HPD72437.1 MauE/DoxX family redox-associated membrane protein [Candidatus Krumholzibacteria bacterium]HRY40631.1 MauE/DoxX family redox-associated membrane protein [Candidatus Krumholzibacteria bacterium]